MAGYPQTPTRDSFGPTYRDKYQVRDNARELGADAVNLLCWQVAGAGRTVPRVVLGVALSGIVPAVAYQALAWDPDGVLPDLAVVRSAQGVYVVTFAPSYADERGVPIPFLPRFGMPTVTSDPLLGAGAQCSGLAVTVSVRDGADALQDASFMLAVWG